MKPSIENPKVFISYAWSNEEYQNKVLSFATALMNDGVDVLFDKWSLKEGNDTYAFMEKSVVDEKVTNVLILLDPVYEEKANNRQGGVGTETQIISNEVYNKTDQTKFLPIVFERKENGDIPKPVYLKQTLHFDLTNDDTYDTEYRRLVKTLYGVEVYKKPEKGNKPAWVDEQIDANSIKCIVKYESIKKLSLESDRFLRLKSEAAKISSKLIEYSFTTNESYVSMYDELLPIRDEILSLFLILPYVRDGVKPMINLIEKVYSVYCVNKHLKENTVKITLLHELFLYLVAICYRNELYSEIGYLFTRSYYSGEYDRELKSFVVLRSYNDQMDREVCKLDDKNYLCGTAEYWIKHINVDVCSKSEFVFADVLCFNASIFVQSDVRDYYWFPLTYPYMSDNYDSPFRAFSKRLESKEKLEDALKIFGFDSIEGFKKRFQEVLDNPSRDLQNFRYMNSFDAPQSVFQYISYDKLGTRN